jgi:hypothetical protein
MKMVPPKAGLPTFEPTEATGAHAKPHMAVPAAATEPPVEESTSTDQASLKRVPIKMVPPAASLFQPNVDATDVPPANDDLTGPSIEPALATPEPHLSTTIAVELPNIQVSEYSLAGGESEDQNPTEELSFNYDKIEYHYLEMDEKKDVRPNTPNWDIDEAKDS